MEDQLYLTSAEYLGYRLKELGVTHLFVVPGDYNLPLLDGLAQVPGLTMVNTANELNAGYAADGHARARGIGCVVTTFLVGALSAINAAAASFAEEVPVLCVVGVPNTSQYASTCALHHTLGNLEDIGQEVDCYKPVTVYQTILRSLTDARYLIDKSLLMLTHKKPVLLEALLPHASFGRRGEPLDPLETPERAASASALEAASGAIAEWLATKKRPLIVVGRRARYYKKEVLAFAEASGYAVTVVADGKGFFPETHPQFIGTYFKDFAPPNVKETVAKADALVFVGVMFNELSWPTVPDNATHERGVIIYKSRAVLALGRAFTAVPSDRLLAALAPRVKYNPGALEHWRGLPKGPAVLPPNGPEFTAPDDAPLKTHEVYDIVQEQLLSEPGYDVVVDTGDALWRSHALRLPEGSAYETQCLAGNIGAGLPTALGFSLGAAARRTVLFQGDGGLQMTAQDIGTFARFGSTAVVVLINNDGYLVERYLSPIAHSSYNYLAPWDYAAVADAMCRRITGAKYRVLRATTRDEAAAAVAEAKALRDHFVFIECVVSPKDAAPGAGAVRRAFCGSFFSSQPLYQKLLANELGRDFIAAGAGAAAKRATSGSISEALAVAAAAASAAAQRRSGEFPRLAGLSLGSDGGAADGAGVINTDGELAAAAAAAAVAARKSSAAAAAAAAMPTIASVGSVASLAASGSGGGGSAADLGAANGTATNGV